MSEPTTTEVTTGLRFPEGPVWCADGTVLCTELLGATVVRVHSDGRKEIVAEPGGSPNGLALGPDGALYVCNSGGWDFHDIMGMTVPKTHLPDHHSGGRIERVDLASGDVKVLYTECDGHKLVGPNDIVFDAAGGMWFTDHGRHRERDKLLGGVYYAQPDGSAIKEVLYPLDAPNGIGLSPDGTRLYVAETHLGRVFAWNVTGPGEVESGSPLGGPGGEMLCGLPGNQLFDSLGIDGDGNVVVATLVTGALTVIAPSGEVLDQVVLGDPMVTNVCFGGDDLRTAYATLSATGRLVSFEWPRPGLRLNFT
jgi:gluconolactonase